MRVPPACILNIPLYSLAVGMHRPWGTQSMVTPTSPVRSWWTLRGVLGYGARRKPSFIILSGFASSQTPSVEAPSVALRGTVSAVSTVLDDHVPKAGEGVVAALRPPSEDVGHLEISPGPFQRARIASNDISKESPADGLRVLMKRSSMLSGPDDLYHQILLKAFNRLTLYPARQDLLFRVLGTLVVVPHPVSLEVIATLYAKHEVFDEINQEDVISFLRRDRTSNPFSTFPLLPANRCALSTHPYAIF